MEPLADLRTLKDFTSLVIKLASPEDIRKWSRGEVLKPETINYRTLKPEKDGLFDERIFGPTKDWECYCGKYKRIRYKGIICDKCGVEVTQSKVRRERMGHIKLAASVAHVWFFKGSPSKLSQVLDIPPKALENVVYFASYLVMSVDRDKQKKAQESLESVFAKRKEEREEKFMASRKDIDSEFEKEKEILGKRIKNKESFDIAVSDLQFKKKQQLTVLDEEQLGEEKTEKEIFSTISDLMKRIRPLSVISEYEYLKLQDYDVSSFFEAGMGAECIIKVLKALDLAKIIGELRKEIQESSAQKKIKATKRLRFIEGTKNALISPVSLILSILPVIPPDLRPMVQLTGGKFATSDLNDLYRRVINRNNR